MLKVFAPTILLLMMTQPAVASDISEEFNEEIQSEGSSMMYAGGLAGSTWIAQDSAFRPIFGLQAGFQIRPHWGYGAYMTLETTGRFTAAGEGSFFFNGALMGLRVGGKAGVHWGGASTQFAWGPHLAYDYALGGGWSIGAEANWLQDSHLLIAGKYWF